MRPVYAKEVCFSFYASKPELLQVPGRLTKMARQKDELCCPLWWKVPSANVPLSPSNAASALLCMMP